MKKLFFLFLISLLIFSSCSKKEIEIKRTDILNIYRQNQGNLEEEKRLSDIKSLNDYYEKLSLKERIGQLFLISLDGNNTKDIERILSVNEYIPGGYLLFAFNIPETAEDTIEFFSELENEYIKNGSIPPYISIDHEGGIVNRLRNICSKLPSQLSVAQKFSEEDAALLYEFHGIQLKNLGIQVNLAPVVEVLTDENVLFLDDRSFGDLSHAVEYSKAQISGMNKAGILPVLKHFPGNTNNDPHTGLPVLDCDKETLASIFLSPFKQTVDKGKTGVLVAHTVIPAVDEKPSCLSEDVISLLNTENETYDGLIFSDDLLMKALIKNGYPVEKSLIGAINAGINILMISTSSYDEYAEIILEEYNRNDEFRNKVDSSVKKILEWKISSGLLERTASQTGFFEYEIQIQLPEPITRTEMAERKDDFQKAYSEASELYNEVWWAK